MDQPDRTHFLAQQLVPMPAEVALVPRSEWSQRRAEPRYHCRPATLGSVVVLEICQTHRGWILDLSVHGVGLLLTQPLTCGALLMLHVKSSDGQRSYELPCRVVHSATQTLGDWLVGCEFADPLSADDLDALL